MEEFFAKRGFRIDRQGDVYVVSDSAGSSIMEIRRHDGEYIISTRHGDRYTASDKDLYNTLKIALAKFFAKELGKLGLDRVVRVGKGDMRISIIPTDRGYSVAYIHGGRVIQTSDVDRNWVAALAATVKGVKI